MRFYFDFHIPIMFFAVDIGNQEIIQLLSKNNKLDINDILII